MYTFSERFKRNYSIQTAIDAALTRLPPGVALITLSVTHRDRNEALTLREVNEVADKMVADSYKTRYH